MGRLSVLFVQNKACSRTWKQAGALAAGGHQVSLFELAEASPFKDYGAFETHVTLDVGGDLRSMIRGRRRIEEALSDHLAGCDYDVIHTANAPDAFGAWVPRLTDTPVVHDVHDIQTEVPLQWGNLLTKRVVRSIRKRWERQACRRAALVLTTSSYMAGYFRDKYGISNVRSIENKPFHAEVVPRRKRSEEDGESHLVYAGGLRIKEGTDRALIPVFRQFTRLGHHVHAYGVFDDDAERQAVERGFAEDPKLHLEALVPQDEFIAEMTRYDAGLIWFRNDHENIRSASPNKLYEFQVAGIPVVTNVTAGFLGAYVRDKGCGYVVSDPPEFDSRFRREDRTFSFDLSDCFLTADELLAAYSVALDTPTDRARAASPP